MVKLAHSLFVALELLLFLAAAVALAGWQGL
jgi:hypothetical protein